MRGREHDKYACCCNSQYSVWLAVELGARTEAQREGESMRAGVISGSQINEEATKHFYTQEYFEKVMREWAEWLIKVLYPDVTIQWRE